MRFRSGSALLPALILLLLCCPKTVLAQRGTPSISCPADIIVTGCDPGRLQLPGPASP
ncbi:MAG: hypothetical protein FD129_2396 [bacterium]|nr:MAG: hypothetical protein FD129_2396 [bacterium]